MPGSGGAWLGIVDLGRCSRLTHQRRGILEQSTANERTSGKVETRVRCRKYVVREFVLVRNPFNGVDPQVT